MSACSGRNYNFRCINVVFWRVFVRVSTYSARRKAELTLAHIREKLPAGPIGTKVGTHVQIQMGMDIYAKQIALRDTRGGALGGVLGGSTIQKYGEAVRMALTLVHVCGFIWEWT